MAKRNLLRFRRAKCPLFGTEKFHSTSTDRAQLDGKQLCQAGHGDPDGQQAVPKLRMSLQQERPNIC